MPWPVGQKPPVYNFLIPVFNVVPRGATKDWFYPQGTRELLEKAGGRKRGRKEGRKADPKGAAQEGLADTAVPFGSRAFCLLSFPLHFILLSYFPVSISTMYWAEFHCSHWRLETCSYVNSVSLDLFFQCTPSSHLPR